MLSIKTYALLPFYKGDKIPNALMIGLPDRHGLLPVQRAHLYGAPIEVLEKLREKTKTHFYPDGFIPESLTRACELCLWDEVESMLRNGISGKFCCTSQMGHSYIVCVLLNRKLLLIYDLTSLPSLMLIMYHAVQLRWISHRVRQHY